MSAVAESLEIQRANRRFIRQSFRTPMLERDHEMALARRWRDDDDVDAMHELVIAYSRLVISAAARYRGYGLAMGDLMQEGLVGLMIAAERFDPDRGVRFSTYAGWWLRSSMQDFILRNWSVVRTGTTAAQKTLFFNLRRLRARLEDDVDGRLSDVARTRIASELRVGVTDVEQMEMRLAANDHSLNLRVSAEGDDEWQDLLVDDAPSPEDNAVASHDATTHGRWLAVALAELSARERKIIRARRLSDDAETLVTIGRRLGISKERVRQIEHRALAKLKASILRQAGVAPGHALIDG